MRRAGSPLPAANIRSCSPKCVSQASGSQSLVAPTSARPSVRPPRCRWWAYPSSPKRALVSPFLAAGLLFPASRRLPTELSHDDGAMKKMTRKNFTSLSNLAAKAGMGGGSSSNSNANSGSHTPPPPTSASSSSSSSNGPSHSNSHTPGGGRRGKGPSWADKVREKLPELEENEYEILWERGVLGVIFLESEKDGIPYVSKATESCISPIVQTGDVLKYVNVVRSKDHSFSEFFKILATMKKPVLLRFEHARMRAATVSSSDDDSPLDQRSNSATLLREDLGPGTPKVQRANSLPPAEQPVKQTSSRGAFWRTVTARDPPAAPVPTRQGTHSVVTLSCPWSVIITCPFLCCLFFSQVPMALQLLRTQASRGEQSCA